MREISAIALAGLLALGCGGGGLGLSGGNSKPRVLDLEVNPTSGQPPKIGLGLELEPDIGDEDAGNCTVDWTLKVWDGTFFVGEPRMVDVDGTYVTGGQASQSITGETAAVYDVIKPGWYAVVITVTDPAGLSSTTTWDFTTWCQSNAFGQCELLPVGDPSDVTDPTIALTSVKLKGTVTDTNGAAVDAMNADSVPVAVLTPTPPATQCTFETQDITISTNPQTIDLEALDAEATPNVSHKYVTITTTP